MRRIIVLLLIVVCFFSINASAQETPAAKKVKNIFIFISDGMGYNQEYIASQWYTGQDKGFGYQNFSFEAAMCNFADGGSYSPFNAWADFDQPKEGATDSAAAGTAMSTGYKTYSGSIGKAIDKTTNLMHIFEKGEELGMSTGVVTSVQFAHATPASFVAHNASRSNYAEIAVEMLEGETDVILGCGHPLYDNDGKRSSNLSYKYVGGEDTFRKIKAGDYGKFIERRSQFLDYLSGETPERLIGIPRVNSTLQQSRSTDFDYVPASGDVTPYQVPQNLNVPTLEEMTRVAINVLDNNENGFLLMVEGGAVDWAGHANQTDRVIEEQVDFARSVEAAVRWVAQNSNWDESLIIVTADHETGYLTALNAGSAAAIPGNKRIGNLAKVGWNSGDHTNQLVPFYAEGAASKGFKRYFEGSDPIRGKYLDNTAVAKYIFKLLEK